ncbi:MAG: ATPase, partial [Saprospiraceae bacterium]
HGQQTTPRSLVQFFQSIENIKNFSEELPLIQMLGSSCLDEETVVSFITFIQQNLSELVKPEQILKTKSFENDVYKHLKGIVQKEVLRVDIIATMCTRLVNYLTLNDIKPNNDEIKNVQSFIKMDIIPNDLRLSMLQDLVSSPNVSLKAVMQDHEVAMMLLQKM